MGKRKTQYDEKHEKPIASVGKYITSQEATNLCEDFCTMHNSKQHYTLFGKNKLLALLEQPGCEGLKFHYCNKKQGRSNRISLVVSGADKNGRTIASRELFLDHGIDCPPECKPPFDLATEFKP